MNQLSAIVVCGGKSSRMGRDKAFLTLGAQTFLSRIVSEIRGVASEVFVTIGSKDPRPFYAEVGHLAKIVGYSVELGSPMSGLVATVGSVKTPFFALIGCDMPLIKSQVVSHIHNKCVGHSAAVPRWADSGVLEPLCAVYSTEQVIGVLDELLAQKRFRLIDLIGALSDVVYVSTDELSRIDASLDSLRNVNTAEEYLSLLESQCLWRH
jgi:molybdopterin-guanine dinucleotide biosynthesis protein A